MEPASTEYQITLFWAHKSTPEVFKTRNIGAYAPGLHVAEGLVMAIKEIE